MRSDQHVKMQFYREACVDGGIISVLIAEILRNKYDETTNGLTTNPFDYPNRGMSTSSNIPT